MSFVQKDQNSRKDKLEKTKAAGAPPERKPRVVVHRNSKGEQHMHVDFGETAFHKEAHLDELLTRLEARHAEEEASKED